MKSPPPLLSPYGVFAGQLFQYSVNPSLVAFESSPPTPSPPPLLPGGASASSMEVAVLPKSIIPPYNNNCNNNKCILLGGLGDGPIPTPYAKLLETQCHTLGWSLVQPILSSSYLGFGHGSLSRDTEELLSLMEYLVRHHSATRFALVGHSTGCQNSMHLLKCCYGRRRRDLVERIKVVALQAPVSDRESLAVTTTPGRRDSSAHLSRAKSLQRRGEGEEMMPRSAFWAPITASRYLSLFDVNGEDDFFSSDLTDDELNDRLGHVGHLGRETGLRALVAFSNGDEYVPESVDKVELLKRLVRAMNGCSERDEHGNNGDEDAIIIARGLMLQNANHNLSNDEKDRELFVDTIGQLLVEVTAQSEDSIVDRESHEDTVL